MDTTSSTDAQVAGVDTSTTAQAATTTDAQVAEGNDTTTLSHEDARKLRSEAANLRKRLKTYEDQEKQAQEATLSQVDKVTKRADEAEQKVKQYQAQLVTMHVKMAAQAKGIIDPDLAALAIQDSLEFGDDDILPTNLDKLLGDLLKSKPFLATAPTPPPANGNKPPSIPAMNPGRTSITTPGTLKPGQIPRLSDVFKR